MSVPSERAQSYADHGWWTFPAQWDPKLGIHVT